ncbi:MAG: 50S ribosomal protein L1 [Candidatus Phytoplasma stylosanthis]|nr:50S ribosomal protein L1 [Candidatus Phytoplasma stylosanthis]MDV3170934.1 50S ribosomal protein L1 [Candidatus Phytoplasma stylosanthis]MDV3174106.1 50S ribosomal protein L1 [Candidatus Phytoplasma stylosanthis]MDV3202374.1 50S ribosomal protein L1 [Candidatus Phytoplasma stylosanthis]
MMKRSKKYLEAIKLIDLNKMYSFTEAIELIKKTKIANFDATVECDLSLKLDPKKVEQNLRGSLILPHGTGKILKVAVLAKGMKFKEAKDANADYVGEEDLIERISQNWVDFDVLISTPDMMPLVAKLGRILGPKGLMPNPKLGTVTNNISQIVKDVKKGRIEYKLDKNSNLHIILGKISFQKDYLSNNLKFLYEHLISVKPKTVKGDFIKSMTLSTTMSPGVKVDFSSIKMGSVV